MIDMKKTELPQLTIFFQMLKNPEISFKLTLPSSQNI